MNFPTACPYKSHWDPPYSISSLAQSCRLSFCVSKQIHTEIMNESRLEMVCKSTWAPQSRCTTLQRRRKTGWLLLSAIRMLSERETGPNQTWAYMWYTFDTINTHTHTSSLANLPPIKHREKNNSVERPVAYKAHPTYTPALLFTHSLLSKQHATHSQRMWKCAAINKTPSGVEMFMHRDRPV